MTQYWTPSPWGRRFTRAAAWRLRLIHRHAELERNGEIHRVPLEDAATLQFERGLRWTRLHLRGPDGAMFALDGLGNAQANALEAALAQQLARHDSDDRVEAFDAALVQVREWLQTATAAIGQADAQRRWFGHELQQAMLRQRPALAVDQEAMWAVFDDPSLRARLHGAASRIEADLMQWGADWPAAWEQRNEDHLRREQIASGALLAGVESRPLTDEQARAVICFDNRVQVVAAAGSGKTSTLVAKAAYAIERGLVAPERMVMLAFNKDAAEELQQRTAHAFQRLGMQDAGVEACTFHALGRRLIGEATGRMPEVPGWAVDATQGFEKLAALIDALKDRSEHFRTQWDMFRLVFGRDLPATGAALAAEGWDADGQGYLRTLQGERVRGIEACVIADWLFYNGVRYVYQGHERFDAGTDAVQRSSVQFHYPDAGLDHAHLGAGSGDSGKAYSAQRHAARVAGRLLQTNAGQLRNGELFAQLGDALAAAGVALDPHPDRELPDGGARPMEHAELIALLRTFIGHAKSNGLGLHDLAQRLRALPEDRFKHRYRLFLALLTPILQAWDDALVAEGGIDFEDMLNQAAEHLEQGRARSPYQLVMADEFQDASRARARLCRALVQAPGSYLFAVGDDWQSINRFAGADVSVMTGFVAWFGQGQVLKLEQTFRCPQALCDVSSRFVSRNPAQMAKQVRSASAAHGPVLQAFQVTSREQLRDAVGQHLQQLQRQLLAGEIAPGRDGRLSVFVLGRYNADRAYLPADWQSRFGQHLDVRFLTAHRAKGAEADYVLLPGMLERGFPNARADDPVLALAMPHADGFPLGEERRLFYVALTRARRAVAMFTVQGRRSPFLDELVNDGAVAVTAMDGVAIRETPCPACDGGVIVQRNGRFGPFHSCSGYPRCEYKPARHPGALRTP